MNRRQRVNAILAESGVDKLKAIMAMLRDQEYGCPWDQKQTFETIVPHTIEEAYEVADAIESGDLGGLKKELGDLLFQVIFYSQLGQEQHLFDFDQIVEAICDKLISRHPHVFTQQNFEDEAAIKRNWEDAKTQEREQKAQANARDTASALDDIPKAMPALSRAYKLQKRASHVGFDWPDVTGALDKVSEEIDELNAELNEPNINKTKVADELGDLYFALTNVSRHLGLKPEDVLRGANNKFERRFRGVERSVWQSNRVMTEVPLEELDAIWNRLKRHESI